MRIVRFVVEMLITAVLAGLAAVAATWTWSVVAHGAPLVDWATSARLAILLGTSLPVTRRVAALRRCGFRVPPAEE